VGYDGIPFGRLAAAELGGETLDLSFSGQTTRNLLDTSCDQIRNYAPDLVLIEIGFVEAMVHPGRRIQAFIERWAPASWHGVAGLEPRARYSRRRYRRMRQMLNSRLKVWFKRFLFKVLSGGKTRVDRSESLETTREFLAFLATIGAHIVLLGLPDVDERLFPGTTDRFDDWNSIIRDLAQALPNTQYLPLRSAVRKWDDYLPDHLHLNGPGHQRAAADVVAAVRQRTAPPDQD
jgi:lysophospholipase L1-like esterase